MKNGKMLTLLSLGLVTCMTTGDSAGASTTTTYTLTPMSELEAQASGPQPSGPLKSLSAFHFQALENLHLPGTLATEFDGWLYDKLQNLEQQYGKGAGDAKLNAALDAGVDWLVQHGIDEAKHVPFLGVVLALPGVADGTMQLAHWAARNLLKSAIERAFSLLDGLGLVNN